MPKVAVLAGVNAHRLLARLAAGADRFQSTQGQGWVRVRVFLTGHAGSFVRLTERFTPAYSRHLHSGLAGLIMPQGSACARATRAQALLRQRSHRQQYFLAVTP